MNGIDQAEMALKMQAKAEELKKNLDPVLDWMKANGVFRVGIEAGDPVKVAIFIAGENGGEK